MCPLLPPWKTKLKCLFRGSTIKSVFAHPQVSNTFFNVVFNPTMSCCWSRSIWLRRSRFSRAGLSPGSPRLPNLRKLRRTRVVYLGKMVILYRNETKSNIQIQIWLKHVFLNIFFLYVSALYKDVYHPPPPP